MPAEDKHRLDKWLWAVRVFKTRTRATDACGRGKVTCNGHTAKASRAIVAGDVLEIRTEERKWRVRVTALPPKRISHSEAVLCYTDLAPRDLKEPGVQVSAFHQGSHPRRTGRPTKKQRRDLRGFTGE